MSFPENKSGYGSLHADSGFAFCFGGSSFDFGMPLWGWGRSVGEFLRVFADSGKACAFIVPICLVYVLLYGFQPMQLQVSVICIGLSFIF